MKCPICKETDLVMADRQGVEIDYCPQCRGVWLDHGELDKIIERSISGTMSQSHQPTQSPPPFFGHDDHHDKDYYKHHQRRSWLREIFD
jgi:uncharacterized protein